MKKTLIPVQSIRLCHPSGRAFATDADYARMATALLRILRGPGMPGLSDNQYERLALALTMYFEDVLADTGLWRAFTGRLHEMYGYYVPFYDTDEAAYMRDEPNLADVAFLAWYIIYREYPVSIVNPHAPSLLRLAETVYGYMEEQFELMPVNEELRAMLAADGAASDYKRQRTLLKWILFDCYLTSMPFALDAAEAEAEKVSGLVSVDVETALVSMLNTMPYERRTGPLALLPQEWLAMVLRTNGQADAARRVEEQQTRPFGAFRVAAVERGKTITLESTKGERIVTDASRLSGKCLDCGTVLTSLVCYDGEWFGNGMALWWDGTGVYDEYVRQEPSSATAPLRCEALRQEAGDSPFLCFGTADEVVRRLKESLPPEDMARVSLPDAGSDVAACLSDDGRRITCVPGVARVIKDPHNPLYSADYARTQGLALMSRLPGETLRRAHALGMLDDAAFASTAEYREESHRLLHGHFDLVMRVIMGERY